MGAPQQFESIVKGELKAHAAWLPISNPYTLGDYGLISDGVFNKMGNIKELGVSFDKAKGPDVSLDFTSEGASVFNFVGGAKVDVIPEGAIDAKTTLKFSKEQSFLIKAPTINVENIENVKQLFDQLKTKDNWKKKFVVVYQIYVAQKPLLLTTREKDTEITFMGSASALQKLSAADASLKIGSNKKLGLEFKGESGVIALGLVRMKTNPINIFRDEIVFLGTGDKQEEGEVEVEQLNDLSLEDDI